MVNHFYIILFELNINGWLHWADTNQHKIILMILVKNLNTKFRRDLVGSFWDETCRRTDVQKWPLRHDFHFMHFV